MEGWLDDLGPATGPGPHASRLWLVHRTQRDAALSASVARGLPGWFDPPLHFLSELGELFGIQRRPIGILTGRLLVARLARDHGRRIGLRASFGEEGPARSHMLDGLIGELLAEGVAPAALRESLGGRPSDEFGRLRNAWVCDTYAALLDALADQGLYDARQIHALAAERIETGGLSVAVRGARTLHVYGLSSLSRRERLFRALAAQASVDVRVYQLDEGEPSEWDDLPGVADAPATVADDAPATVADAAPRAAAVPDVAPVAPHTAESEDRAAGVTIRPAPDAVREAAYVARRVKQLLAAGECRPSEVAVVARSGREDTRRIHRALEDAGVPSSARLRTVLAQIPALRALLDLFGAEASGWDYGSLRTVGTSPYFAIGLDARPLDYLASERRIAGLANWEGALAELAEALAHDRDHPEARRLRGRGIGSDRVAAAARGVARLREHVAGLAGQRGESDWIDLTRSFTAGGGLEYLRRICRVVGGRYDLVRLDQRGVRVLDSLLAEWRGLLSTSTGLTAADWHGRLRRLLEANELALSTPSYHGVKILEAHEAALTPFRHVFVVHANDGEFPRTPRAAGIFTDGERAALRAAGLPLEDRTTALRRERSLWRAVTAGESVTLTYRTSTSAGVPLLPSLMVPDHEAESALPRTIVHADDDLEAVSRAEQLRLEVLRLARKRRGGEEGKLEVADVPAVRHAVLGAFAEELRAGRLDDVESIEPGLGLEPSPLLGRDRPLSQRSHAWNGRLRDPALLQVIGERFGPEHVWSASQLQQYAVRPFDFLLARVLRIELREEAGEETSPMASGSVVHAVLEALHGRLLGADEAGFAAGPALLEEVSRDVFKRLEREAGLWLGLPALWNLKRAHLRETVRGFVTWDFAWLAKRSARPEAVEARFGSDGAEPVEITGTDLAGRPAALRLAGRIDRVDRVGRAGDRLRIVDYKLGDPPARKRYDDGALLQSALYSAAWERLGSRRPSEALFLSIRNPGKGSMSGLKDSGVEDVLRFALSIPARVRAGLFEPVQAATAHPASDWQPGPEITRTQSWISAGHRFDNPAEGAAPGSPGDE